MRADEFALPSSLANAVQAYPVFYRTLHQDVQVLSAAAPRDLYSSNLVPALKPVEWGDPTSRLQASHLNQGYWLRSEQ
jgi:hypothetical protein